jgi:hypothetical protein
MVKATFAKIQKGISFPRMKVDFLMGETLICSIVPISFSETMFSAESIPPTSVTRNAKIPGTRANL